MSHTYGSGNTGGNNYLNKKRLEDDIQMDNRYHYDKYEKFDKYGNHGRYNNMNYIHSKPPQGNNYYNTNSRYRGNYYNNPKPFHSNSYSNKLGPKRDYKKPYQKYSNQNVNEGIRNLSHCDMPSPTSLSLKQKQDGDSLKSISSSTATGDLKGSLSSSSNGINIKNIKTLVSNITSRLPSGRVQPIFQNCQQNIIEIKLSSPSNLKYKDKKNSEYKEENKKWRKEEKDKEEEIPIFKFPKPSEKLLNYQPFNRNSIKIEENPLENFEVYPKTLFELNSHNISRKLNSSIKETMSNVNIQNMLSINSCYLLAKIPNWRLVTNFVPASSLTEEKYKKIIPLEEDEIIKEPEKEREKKKEKPKKSYLVYSEKYDEIVDKSLEHVMLKKRQVKKDIFNKRYIIAQYNYDILKLKNKLKQNKYIINYLNIKLENSRNAIDDKAKKDSFSAFS